MLANELMIGDFIYQHHPNDNTPHIVKVSVDTLDLMYKMEIGFIQEQSRLYRIIEPIPLTPEILEKNDFTRYGQVYANLQQWVGKFGDKRKLLFQDIRTGQWGTNDVWIEYVHELQHALNLCGIEKTIEL